eukprot:scaffold36249_cov36-Cyclotella_meneghiniana.AAC.2
MSDNNPQYQGNDIIPMGTLTEMSAEYKYGTWKIDNHYSINECNCICDFILLPHQDDHDIQRPLVYYVPSSAAWNVYW